MTKELEKYGFKFDRVKYCCAGVKNEIFKKGIFEIKFRPRHNIFKIKRQGSDITGWHTPDKLDQKLKAIYEFKEFFKEQNIQLSS